MTDPLRHSQAIGPDLLAGYNRHPVVPDELFDEHGQMRPVWAPFIEHLAQFTREDCADRFALGDQYLRDAGVYYRQYSSDAPGVRDWPLSHIPVLLGEAEWTEICAGLTQRAELLERVVADLYGEARLVRDGHLPPELVARNPEWHRALVGVAPASGHYLHHLAFEIGRSPDGTWLVLADRTQAPSGAGFALENRRATTRIFPDAFARQNIVRLAAFFGGFRDAMDGLAAANGQRSAILTPGPANDTYFEHAYIARYLGMMLLEGDDLVVENGQLQVRTVSGPLPLGVLWRRMDAGYSDPMELDETSRIGTPGLVDALRRQSVEVINALQSGILETRALMAFMPKIAEVLLGERLALPNIATWWCGQAAERAYVVQNADRMFIGEALGRGLPFDMAGPTPAGRAQPGATSPDLSGWVDMNGLNLVAQETVSLSTTPAWIDGRLEPRPMSVRVFAARTPDGWIFMPGGYARIGRSGDASALAMQRGGSVADVWIVSETPAQDESLLSAGSVRRKETGTLPSRAADNLFWLGRYVERVEGAVRLLRAYHLRHAESGSNDSAHLAHVAALLKTLSISVEDPLHTALAPILDAAQNAAGRVRDRFSVDGWAALRDMASALAALPPDLPTGDASARAMRVFLRKISGFNGLVHENMHRTSGWRFLTLGRALERGDGAAAVLSVFLSTPNASGLPEIALEYGDCWVTHQRRYRIDPIWSTVNDLMVLDVNNPRSVQYQITVMRSIAEKLPHAHKNGRVSPVLELLLPLEAELSVADPTEVDAARLTEIRGRLAAISNRLTSQYLI